MSDSSPIRRRRRIGSQETSSINFEDAYRRSPRMIALNLLVAMLFAASIWGLAPETRIINFIIATLLSSAVRIAVVVCFWKFRQKLSEFLWMIIFIASMWLAATTWSLGGLWLMQGATVLGQIVVMFYLTALAMGGSAAYHALSLGVATRYQSAFVSATHGTITISLLPASIYALFHGSGPVFMLGIGMLLGMLQSIKSSTLVQSVFNNAVARSVTDVGSGLLNRRGFFEGVRHVRSRIDLLPSQNQWRVLMVDIDHFKQINDQQGHAFGDEVIKLMGTVLLETAPTEAVCGRLGGEEFGVLMSASSASHARELAEAIRKRFSARATELSAPAFRASCSIGVSGPASPEQSIDLLLNEADRMLYRAKEEGRDRVIVAPEPAGEIAGKPDARPDLAAT